MNARKLFNFASGLFGEKKPAAGPDPAQEKLWLEYVAAARKRCQEYRELRYCGKCHLALHAFQSFCEQCESATVPLPASFAVDYAQAEFPDLVKSREDFDRLLR
jgi:hypothetical protein